MTVCYRDVPLTEHSKMFLAHYIRTIYVPYMRKEIWMYARVRRLIERWGLFAVFAWQEIVLKASTTGEFWPQLLFLLPLTCALSLFVRTALSLFTPRHSNKIAKVVCIVATGVLLSFEYFVYRKFKLFYDPATVFAGAGDAAKGFGGTALALVFSPAGILHILLFMAPAIAYGLIGRGEDLTRDGHAPLRARMLMLRDAFAAQLAAYVIISCVGTFGRIYTDQYTFQAGVTDFGLMTALRKEASALTLGTHSKVSFTSSEVTTEEDANVEAPAPEPETDKGPNALNIDFNALAATTDGTWADLDRYVASLTPSSKNDMTGRFSGYNLIFITAEALSAEAIRPDTTPMLYRMATNGIQFLDYYQFDTAGTTGGECGNIFGLLPTEGGVSLKLTSEYNNYLTIGSALNRLGYNGWAFHNNTHTYYDRDLTHNNLGYSNGFMGFGNGMEKWVEWQWPQSDLEMMRGTFDELYGSPEHEPFNVYYMSVSGHSDYGFGENDMAEKNWDAVADLPYSDPVKGYLASNIELDLGVQYLVHRLEELGMADHTAFVIGADHFPYGLDDDGPLGSLPYTSELYGYEVITPFQRDHNRLIIWTPTLEQEEPVVVSSPTSTVDILPTLLNLFGCDWDSRLLPGRDVFSDKPALVFSLSYDWKSDLGTYYAGTGEFIPAEGAQVPEGYVQATSTDVANRINYCRGVLTTDYYAHIFGPKGSTL